MNVRTLKDNAGAVFSPKVSADSVYLSGSNTNLTSKLSTVDSTISGKLDKLTYEFSKELAMGSSGYVCIGRFPCYDSNITINVDSTTSTTYHGTLVIATQNINTSGGGTLTANVYEDVNNTLTPALKLEYNSGSRNVNVYFQPASWSKNLVHVRCVALKSEPTDILTSISSIPSTANRTITNVLKSAIDGAGGEYLPLSGGTCTGNIYAPGFYVSSLRSLKENIEPTKVKATDLINSQEIVDFNYKADEDKVHKVGLIADDSDPLFLDKKGETVDLYNMCGILMKAVQELSARVKELESKIN